MAGYSVTFSVVDEATAQIEAINRKIRQMREPFERMQKSMTQFIDVSGLKKVAESFGEIGRYAGVALESMARLVPAMGAITGAASLAGMATLVKTWGDLGTIAEETGTRIGSSAKDVYDMQQATLRAGGNADDMTDALKGLNQQLYLNKIGSTEASVWLQRMHIDQHNANGTWKSTAEILPQIFDGLNNLKDPAERLAAGTALGSRNLVLLAEQFARTGRSLADYYAEAKRLDPTLDPEKLEKYREAVGGLSAAFRDLVLTVGGELAPILTPALKSFGEWIRDSMPGIIQAVKELAAAFGYLNTNLAPLIGLPAAANQFGLGLALKPGEKPFSFTDLWKDPVGYAKQRTGFGPGGNLDPLSVIEQAELGGRNLAPGTCDHTRRRADVGLRPLSIPRTDMARDRTKTRDRSK